MAYLKKYVFPCSSSLTCMKYVGRHSSGGTARELFTLSLINLSCVYNLSTFLLPQMDFTYYFNMVIDFYLDYRS